MLARRHRVSVCLTVAIFLLSSALFASDTVLIHGHIYTGDPKAPWAAGAIHHRHAH